jgi:hypothetical protein
VQNSCGKFLANNYALQIKKELKDNLNDHSYPLIRVGKYTGWLKTNLFF